MVAKTPDEIDTLFAKALNAGDLDALVVRDRLPVRRCRGVATTRRPA